MNELNDTNTTTEGKTFRCGYVAILGEPNVGKSTLMNALIGQKISIVTKKPQTTRHKILGIITEESFQIIFLDTPGLIQPKYRLHEAMMKFAATAVNDADVILMMIDATDTTSAKTHELIFTVLQQTKKPVYLLLNKIDIVPKQSLLSLIADYSANYSFKEVFPISALTKEGTEVLVSSIAQELPVHPPYYPSDSLSEQSVRFFVSEIIREKIFELFEEEIPYSTTVDVIEFTEKENRKTTIQAEIYIERDSQKAILIGKKGQAIKEIGVMARKDIELLLDKEVFLQLYVKVRENWREDDAWLKRLGYSE